MPIDLEIVCDAFVGLMVDGAWAGVSSIVSETFLNLVGTGIFTRIGMMSPNWPWQRSTNFLATVLIRPRCGLLVTP